MKRFFNHIYYPFLVHTNSQGLFADCGRSSCIGKLVVCLNAKNGYRYYTVFSNYSKFLQHMLAFPVKDRSFFEIIMGEAEQKPHFDIDIDPDIDIDISLVLDDLITNIISVMNTLNLPISLTENICLYKSTGSKKSYHLIIDKYYHLNNREAKEFYNLVVSNINPLYKDFIDSSVYSKLQQFRILGCQKFNTMRIKEFQSTFFYQNVEYTHLYSEPFLNPLHELNSNLAISLVSFIADSKPLPQLCPDKVPDKYLDFSSKLTQDEIKSAILLLCSFNKTSLENLPFVYDKVESPLILLKRVRPSFCNLCQRRHDTENVYLLVRNDMEIMYSCRRNKNYKFITIGHIASTSQSYGLNKNVKSKLNTLLKKSHPDISIKPIKKARRNKNTKYIEHTI